MSEISVEVFFNSERVMCFRGRRVVGCEAFSKDMGTLVMFVFESALSKDFVNVFNFDDFVSMFLEVFPDGVVFGWTGVDADDFTNE